MSIKVLAEYLSLSPATISLVLNDAPAGKSIPEPTRQRVREGARKLGYRPSLLARSLRRQKSYTVGVMLPEINDPYSTLIMTGLDDVLQEEGYLSFAISHRRKPDLIEEYPRILLDRSVEGIIVIDTPLPSALPIPTVSIGGLRLAGSDTQVSLDHHLAARLVLRHLHKLGHREIAYIRGPAHASDAGPRFEELQQIARELGLETRTELVEQLQSDSHSPVIGYPVVARFLQARVPFTAIVCFNDFAAIGVTRALVDAGLRVPEDVSVTGFDDIQPAAFHNPSITTIRQPLREMGRQAARALLSRIRGGEPAGEDITVLPEMVIRESTAQARRR